MSLRVWLPLTKDLRNQGLDDVTIINNGATFDANGKLGGCYYFNRSAPNYLKITNPLTTATNGVSMAFWVKLPSNGSVNDQLVHIGNGFGWTNNRFTCFVRGGNSTLIFACGDGTNSTQYSCVSSALTLNQWTHVVCLYENNKMKIYLNGALDKEYSTTIVPSFTNVTYVGIGAGPNVTEPATAYLNDVRIYDHALSPLEVKHISQGLILHYPLNRGGWGNDNILINTHFDSQTTKTSGWDTIKNGTQMASSWDGFNGGVPNPSTVYHARLKQVNNEWVYEYIRTADESWLGISQGGLQLKLIAGKTYTFSWEEYRVEGNNYPTGGLYYFKTGATSANFHLGQFGGSHGNVLGKWRKFSYTFVAPTDGDYSKNMSWYIYGQSGGNGKMYMRHPKLEEGSIATSWCPNSSDVLATTMGLNDNIEYDTSGYGNNGIKIGTFDYDSDTPKYNVSTVFPSGINWINAGRGAMVQDSITISCWVNYSSWGNPISCTEGGGWNFEEGNGGIRTPFYISGIGYKTAQSTITSASLKNGWHMLTSLYDRINSIVKIFIDGELAGSLDTGTTNKIAYNGNNVIMIGAEAGGSATSPASTSFIGKISDFRIYATALSAEDIKDLYNLGASIDSNNNLLTYELNEE